MFNVPGLLRKEMNEPQEVKIENMLRLSGMSINIKIISTWVVSAVFLIPLLLWFSALGCILIAPNVSFGVIFLVTLIMLIQLFVVQDVITYGLGRGPLALVIKIMFYLLMLLVTILKTFMHSNGPLQTHVLCILFPAMQLQ